MRASGFFLVGILGVLAGGCGSTDVVTAPSIPAGNKATPDKGAPPPGDDAGALRPDGTDAGAPVDATPPEVQSGPLAKGMTVQEVAVFQAVKIDVLKDGVAVKKADRNALLVAKRDALVRVYVGLTADYAPHPVTAELHLVASDGTKLPVLRVTKTVDVASTDSVPASTFDFTVPGDSLPRGITWTVSVRETSGDASGDPATSTAQYPASGTPEPLEISSTGDVLKVVVVPVQYGADGSNRIPDITPAMLETYRKAMYSFYPAAKVDVSARAPFPYTKAINASGSGFGSVLQAIVDLRQQDGVGDDVYYYGAFAPSATFNNYCGQGCVTGLSGVGDDPTDATVRASVGIGFTGSESAITMAHELGHAHGRLHSPCGGAGGPDPNYPYAGGGIGVLGYNLVTQTFVPTTKGRDLMGYCQPEWISDYTYQALFDRMATVNKAMDKHGTFTPQPYRFVTVESDGSLTWGSNITLRSQPAGELHTVSYLAPNGTTLLTATGHYYAYDHLPGGYLLVPEGPPAFSKLSVTGLNARPLTHLARTY